MSRLTHRRLAALIEQLPGESAYKTAVRDSLSDEDLAELARKPRDKHGPWSHEALLLAAAIDRIELLRRDLVAVNGAKPSSDFEPVPRPGIRRPRRRAANPAAAAYIRRLAQQHAELHGYASEAG